MPGITPDIGRELQLRSRGRCHGHEGTGQPAQQGYCHQYTDSGMVPALHQQRPADLSHQDGNERAHFDQAVATDQFAPLEVLWQYGVFHRAEKGRVRSHQEQCQQECADMLGIKAPGSQRHDGDLGELDGPCHPGLVELFGQPACRGRKQEKRQDEHGCCKVDDLLGWQAGK